MKTLEIRRRMGRRLAKLLRELDRMDRTLGRLARTLGGRIDRR